MSLPLASGTWNVDKAHSSVEFSVKHLGLTNVRGRFDSFDSALVVGGSLADTVINATIALSSINTNNADRDNHLKGTDFFGVESNAEIGFKNTSIEQKGSDYKLIGELTLRGITKPITLDIDFGGVEPSPFDQKPRAGFSAEGILSRKDFGIEFNVPLGGDKFLISDKVKLQLELQFVQ